MMRERKDKGLRGVLSERTGREGVLLRLVAGVVVAVVAVVVHFGTMTGGQLELDVELAVKRSAGRGVSFDEGAMRWRFGLDLGDEGGCRPLGLRFVSSLGLRFGLPLVGVWGARGGISSRSRGSACDEIGAMRRAGVGVSRTSGPSSSSSSFRARTAFSGQRNGDDGSAFTVIGLLSRPGADAYRWLFLGVRLKSTISTAAAELLVRHKARSESSSRDEEGGSVYPNASCAAIRSAGARSAKCQ